MFAERASLPADLLAHVPAGLDPVVAATMPVVALTADLAVRAAGAGTGTTVLVLGAAGAVGSYVTQLATTAGATVLASVSRHDFDEVNALGATAFDRNDDVGAAVVAAFGHVDTIIDLVGPAARQGAIDALRPGGRLVTTIPGPLPELPTGSTGNVIAVQPDPRQLIQLGVEVAAGTLTTGTGSRFALEDIRHGLALAPTAGNTKVVVTP